MSILVDAAQCRRRGLPQADFFLWNDDFEFTTRLLRGTIGLLCPASVVVHKTKTFGSTDADPGDTVLLRGPEQDLDAQGSRRSPRRSGSCTAGATLRRWAARTPGRPTGASSPPHSAGASPPGCGPARGPTSEVLAAAGLTLPGPAVADPAQPHLR